MDDDPCARYFLIGVVSVVAIIAASVSFSCAYKAHQIKQIVAMGHDPIAAACAIQGFEENNRGLVCVEAARARVNHD